jgi:nucleoside-triphosphatase THEP1
MENQEANNDGRIKVFITYKAKRIPFSADPRNNLKVTIDNIVKLSKTDIQKYWNLPEINNGGQRITYRLGKIDNGKNRIFQNTNDKREEQCLEDYGIKEGDELILAQKVIAG